MSVDVQRVRAMNYEPTTADCPHCGQPLLARPQTGAVGLEPDVAVVTVPQVDPVRGVAAGVVRVLLEVVDGRRRVEQVAAVASPSVCRYMRAARLGQAAPRVFRVRSLRLCRPAESVLEAAAVVAIAGRVRALAARLERTDGAWRCVAFRIL